MAGITLAEAQTKLSEWMAASTAVSHKQSYSIAGRTITLADTKEIRESIIFWNEMVNSLDRGGPRVRTGIPL
jgi:hypothetical protein